MYFRSCALRTRDKGGRGHKLEIRNDFVSNALTSVSKDTLVLEIITEEGDILTEANEITPNRIVESKSDQFTFVELFAGIGGVSFGFEKAGGKCLMAAEYDPAAKTQFAQKAYGLLHPNVDLRGDVTKLDAESVPDHDVLSFTTPCQSFSVAGKRGGFEDVRGTLYFEAMRIAKEKKPKIIFMENVKGIVGHDGGKTIDTLVKVANECGYTVDFNVINSKYFDVPHTRERFFMIGVRDDLAHQSDWVIEGNNVLAKGKRRIAGYDDVKTFNFDWPAQEQVTTSLQDILETEVDERYYLPEDKTVNLIAQLEASGRYSTDGSPIMLGHVDLKGHDAIKRVYSPEGIAPTLTTMGGGHREPKIAEHKQRYRIRKLTPLECFRLQGFSDEAHQTLVDAGISNSQRYKQAGNAVTVNVIEAIGERLLTVLDGN